MPGGELSYQHRASGPGDVPPAAVDQERHPAFLPGGPSCCLKLLGSHLCVPCNIPNQGPRSVWALSPLGVGVVPNLGASEMQWDGVQAVLSADRSSLWAGAEVGVGVRR